MPHPDAKERLARALRDALTTVPLSKVTVSGITRTAGVTRQAFYYHFSDIRDLTVWVFKREVADQIIARATYEDWSDGLLAMFVWMQNHPEETRSVVSSTGLEPWGRFEMRSSQVSSIDDEHVELNAVLTDGGETVKVQATGTGPIDAFVSALHEFDLDVRILDYSEHAMSQGRDARAAAYVEAAVDGQIVWGVGIDSSITRASYKAVISAVNRALR